MNVRGLLRMLRHYNPDAEVLVRVGTKKACQWEAYSVSAVTNFRSKSEWKRTVKREPNILDRLATEVTIEGRPGGRRKR